MLGIPFYGRLSTYYFLYYALLGVLVPYWALFLQARGFSSWQIGVLLAVPHITKLGAPNIWGWLADKTGERVRIIRMGNLFSAIIFPWVFLTYGFWSMVLVLAGYSFFWNAVMAQCEALVLETLGQQSHRYSLIRLWGSLGFIVTVLVLGFLVERAGVTTIAITMSALLLALWLASLALPSRNSTARMRPAVDSIWPLLWRAPAFAFFVAGLLMQLSHGPYYGFFTLYLDGQGVATRWVGALWTLGVVAEILLFMGMAYLLKHFSVKRLLVASLALTVARWSIMGSGALYWGWLVLAQSLHAASFACYHASAMAWLHEYFPFKFAGRAQAFYASFSLGAGWALGAILAGALWEEWQQATFYMAALAAGVAMVLLWVFLPHSSTSKAD